MCQYTKEGLETRSWSKTCFLGTLIVADFYSEIIAWLGGVALKYFTSKHNKRVKYFSIQEEKIHLKSSSQHELSGAFFPNLDVNGGGREKGKKGCLFLPSACVAHSM